MNYQPEWYYRLEGFIYAENYDECEVIASEREFFDWVVKEYDLDEEREADLWYLFWLDYGNEQFYNEFYKHITSCKP